jgi:Uma2 family endonuclease
MAALAESVGLEHLSVAGLTFPITLRLPVPLSDEELIAFSRRNTPYRIERNENGELEITSPVGLEGSHREVIVMSRLAGWSEDHGGVTFSSNGGFTLPDGSVRSPDASWVSDARWNALSKQDQRRYAPICPEFLIEVLSENDSRAALEEKMERWIGSGAQLAWMIDPFARAVSVYRPGAPVYVLQEPDLVEADTVVPGLKLSMAKLWDR